MSAVFLGCLGFVLFLALCVSLNVRSWSNTHKQQFLSMRTCSYIKYLIHVILLTSICAGVTPCCRKKFLALPLPLSFIIWSCSAVHSSKSTDLTNKEYSQHHKQSRSQIILPNKCDMYPHSSVNGTAIIADKNTVCRRGPRRVSSRTIETHFIGRKSSQLLHDHVLLCSWDMDTHDDLRATARYLSKYTQCW